MVLQFYSIDYPAKPKIITCEESDPEGPKIQIQSMYSNASKQQPQQISALVKGFYSFSIPIRLTLREVPKMTKRKNLSARQNKNYK